MTRRRLKGDRGVSWWNVKPRAGNRETGQLSSAQGCNKPMCRWMTPICRWMTWDCLHVLHQSGHLGFNLGEHGTGDVPEPWSMHVGTISPPVRDHGEILVYAGEQRLGKCMYQHKGP
jgi:hypothetical protein